MTSSRLFVISSVVVLTVGFVVDVVTSANVVVGILLSIPIALAAFTLSRRFTLGMILAVLIANGLAGLENAVHEGAISSTSLLNRAFSVLAAVLVGILALSLREASARAERLAVRERQARTEQAVRDLAATLPPTLAPREFLSEAATGLRELLGARHVTIAAVIEDRLASPHVSTSHGPFEAGWISPDANGTTTVSMGGRQESVMTRRWARRDGPPLVVIALSPTASAALLDTAVAALEPLLDQAAILDDLRRERVTLEQRNTVIRDLVYAFSHDLRTPLMANTMSMRLALSGAYGTLPEEYRASLETGLASNQDLLDLADKLLLLAKLESGELTEGHVPLDLRDVVARRAAELRPAFETRGVTLDLDLDPGVRVLGVASELRRVVQNLLDNALRYAPIGGTVTVRLHAQAGEAVLTVTDDGPGVPAHLESRLFQRFRGSGAGAGSGLGLYLARTIVEAHGGTITYRRTPRARTAFEVHLPRAQPTVEDRYARRRE